MPNSLPAELSFINEFRLANVEAVGAKWLTSGFHENVWQCRFGDSVITIDFGITLLDGSLLTHRSNAGLLEAIKRYLFIQTHPTVLGVAVLSTVTGLSYLNRALHVLDHFFLRGSFIQAHSAGYRQLSKNDIHDFTDTVSSSRAIKNNIYEPEERIYEFVRSLKVTAEDMKAARKRLPEIFETESLELPEGLSEEQVQVARVWLHKNGFYRSGSKDDVFKLQLTPNKLLTHIIGKHVLANLKFDNLELDYLSFGPRERFIRELRAVAVHPGGEDERAAAEFVQSYMQTLSVMEVGVTPETCLVSEDALSALEEKEALKNGRLKQKGRFATLPFEVANQSFKHAIEFYLEYGHDLVTYYLSLAERDWQENVLLDVPVSLRRLGITKFESIETTAEDFFAELRRGSSLYQMLQVLLGAIVILVNTLMARRASELLGLTSDSIVKDGEYFFLRFDLGKANIGELRKRVLRPLPELGAEALGLLAELSQRLSDLGYESSPTLFQRFKWKRAKFTPYGTAKSDAQWMRLCLDRFCDYFEMDTDEDGARYYIRPHQLRRNFAMLFFWQGSFGGIHVLRYFLGHQKPSLTYRYVTEQMQGKVLRQVKAKVATELIKVDSAATESLAALICERYGVTLDALHVLPEADVCAYVEDLLQSNEAEIEPEFIDGPDGEEYKILYKVRAPKFAVGDMNG